MPPFTASGPTPRAILSGTYGINPWLALVCAVAAAVLIAFIVGLPTLRLSGYYLPWYAGLRHDCQHCDSRVGRRNGRGIGICGNTRAGGRLPGLHGRTRVLFPCLGHCVYCHDHLPQASFLPHGRALRAIHDGEKAAVAIGINTHFLKLEIFMFSPPWARLQVFCTPILSFL